MSKLYDNLIAPEWRTAIYPGTAGDSVLKGLRVLTGRIAALTNLTLSTETVRPLYSTINVPLADIEYVNALAMSEDDAVTAGSLVAGELSGGQFLAFPDRINKYRFKSTVSEIDAFGLGITDAIGIVGRDFFYSNGYYWFNEHPSKFGSIGIENARTVLTLPCLGGAPATSEMPLGIAYQNCADYSTLTAVNDAVYGNAPNGITNELLYAIGGAKLTNDILEQVWEEGNYILGITKNGELVYAPKASGITFTLGASPNIDVLLSPDESFLVPTSLDNYIILLTESYDLSNLPGIAKDFPQLSSPCSGVDILATMYERGCVFYTLKYINKGLGVQQTLGHFSLNPGKVIITTIASTHATVEFKAIPDIRPFVITATDTSGTTNII